VPQTSFVPKRALCTHVGSPHPPYTCPSKHEWNKCCPHQIVHRFDSAEWQRERRKSVRLRVLEAYGGKCVCCGEAGEQFLCLDHKDGKGKEHRATLNHGRQTDMYDWAMRHNYPELLQLLCFNCNYARNYYGKCHS